MTDFQKNYRVRHPSPGSESRKLAAEASLPANLVRLSNHPRIEMVNPANLTNSSRLLRQHSERQLVKLEASIRRFGFLVPVLATAGCELITGGARLEAARRAGMDAIPVIRIDHLTEAEIRAFRIADNRLAELGEWNEEHLAIELKELLELDLDFSIELTGFDTAEIDLKIAALAEAGGGADPADEQLPPPAEPVCRPADLWVMDGHRLYCGDALEESAYEAVMPGELAQQVFTDPPYNCPIDGYAGGLGKYHHRPFAMAAGEMNQEQFTAFLTAALVLSRRYLMQNGLAYYFMDRYRLHELTVAQQRAGFDLINVCCWVKTNGGMGSLYRSQFEPVLVFGNRNAGYINNVQLGRFGRYRTNVWEYAGLNSFGKNRSNDLADHPTVKPVALVADAILDVTHRGDLVLDPFAGSGTTILAAEKIGRKVRAIELDPAYVDVAIRRWSQVTGKSALLSSTGQTFEEVREQRRTTVAGEQCTTAVGIAPRIRQRRRATSSAQNADQ